MGSIKTFIGIKASQRVTNNVSSVVKRMAAKSEQYNWVEPENLHVTLNYVGAVVDIEVPELCQLVKQAIKPHVSFDLSLHGVSGFPTPEQPRVLWIGVDEGKNALEALYRSLEDVLHHWGVNKDRNAYVPHMTLGRIGRAGRWSEDLMELVHKLRNHDGGFCHIDEVIVYSSYRERGGVTYTPMATLRLKGCPK